MDKKFNYTYNILYKCGKMVKINSINAFYLIIITASQFLAFDLNSKDIQVQDVDVFDSIPHGETSDSFRNNKPVRVDTITRDSLSVENTDSNIVPLGGPPDDADGEGNSFEEGASSEYAYPSVADMENIPGNDIESHPGGKVVPVGAPPGGSEELKDIKNTESEYNEDDDTVSKDRAKDKE